ncbi:hypothetical protein EBR57_08345 [bacterium]|nr:hypothetical protein [bacterium]
MQNKGEWVMKNWQSGFDAAIMVDAFESPIEWTVTETFVGAFQDEIQSQTSRRLLGDTVGGAELWNQLVSGEIPLDQIEVAISRLETIPVTKIPVKKRLEMAYMLSSPPAFPKPKVVVQELFSTDQILRWIASVLPEGCAIECYDDFRWNTLPAHTGQHMDVASRQKVLDTAQTHYAVVQVWLDGACRHIGITLPTWYVRGKCCDDILSDFRLIFGANYRKEILSYSTSQLVA